jgi:putative hydrolase of the HAD superfamily
MPPRAVLFDLDDTILMFSAGATRCWRVVCDGFAGRLGTTTSPALQAAIGEYSTWYWSDAERHRRGRLDLAEARRAIVAGAFRRLGVDDPLLAAEIADAYSARRDELVQPFPDAIAALTELRRRGVRLGLITNGEAQAQRAKIERHRLAGLFDSVLVEGEFGVGKPDERVFRHTLRRLGATPDQAWMVGDHLEWDVDAAQKLGIFGIWLDHAGTGLPTTTAVVPDRVIRSVGELL